MVFVSSSKEVFFKPALVDLYTQRTSVLIERSCASFFIVHAHPYYACISFVNVILDFRALFFSSRRAKSCAMEKSFGIENGSNARQQ